MNSQNNTARLTYKERIEAKRMLRDLQKQERFYRRLLSQMEEAKSRLQAEALFLTAKIHQEEKKEEAEMREKANLSSKQVDDGASCSKKGSPRDHSKTYSKAPNVQSNIRDDRYLEPLILNPNYDGDDNFIEFDD